MVIFRPFEAVRPASQELAEKIASLPYDVIDSIEARELARGNPFSFLHVVKPEIDLDPNTNPYDVTVYEKGKENLEKFKERGWLIQDEKPYFHVYRQIMGGCSQSGIVGCVSAQDYWDGKIKKHELTRKDKEEDRVRHIDAVDANTGLVFSFYRRCTEVDKIVHEVVQGQPIYDFTSDDGIRHTVWRVEEGLNNKIMGHFSQISHIYIADGHHRAAAAARIAERRRARNRNHTGNEEYNFFMAAVFSVEDLLIMGYNRVVKNLNGLYNKEYLEKVAERFEIIKAHKGRRPTRKGTFGMYFDGEWYLLTPRPGTYEEDDPIKSLDASILQDNLLTPTLGIKDPRSDKNIDFVGGVSGMDELERRVDGGGMKVAFAMFPTGIEELMRCADSDLMMPPKSTWFEPKLRSGLLIHSYSRP
jgi:uncharacterized protein (DUF1015 family)